MPARICRRQGCSGRAKVTLTFSYADQTAVLGPLAPQPVPEGQDLCAKHAQTFSVPRGWEVLRLPLTDLGTPSPSPGDLITLAEEIRSAAGVLASDPVAPPPPPAPLWATPPPTELPAGIVTLAERRHLRVVADAQRQAG